MLHRSNETSNNFGTHHEEAIYDDFLGELAQSELTKRLFLMFPLNEAWHPRIAFIARSIAAEANLKDSLQFRSP